MHRPLVILTLMFGLGVFLARHFDLAGGHLLLPSGIALLVASIAWFAARKSGRWLLLALFVLLGMAVTALVVEQIETPLSAWEDQMVVLEGVVLRDADVRPDRTVYSLAVRQARLGERIMQPQAQVLVSHYDPDVVYSYGDVLEVRGLLRRPPLPGNPGEFDYRAYLERRGIALLMTVRGEGTVEKIGLDPANPVVYQALILKERLMAGLERVLEPEQTALVRGITLGVRGGIAPETRETFVVTGVVHILSVSGLHVGFLLGLTLFFTRFFRLHPAWITLLVFTVLAFYMVMVGFKPSVVRAAVMALLLLVSYQLGRLRDWPTAMAAAALVILLGDPLALFDPGFQLSFTATWGILYLGPPLVKGLDRLAASCRKIAWKSTYSWVLAVPLAAQLATLPLVAYYYNLVSPVALLANVVAVPMVGFIFALGLVTAVLSAFVPVVAWLTGPATGALVDVFLALVRLLAGLPGAYFYVATPPLLLIITWYLLLYGLGFAAGSGTWRERLSGWSAGWAVFGRPALSPLVVGLFLVIGFLIWPSGPAPSGNLEVHFLDVGQGDCAVIFTGTGKTVLIDAGGWRGELEGESGVAEKVLLPYLRRHGVRQIDLLVITHAHEDHAGGARGLVAKMDIKKVVIPPFGGQEVPAAGYFTLLKQFEAAGIPVQLVWAGDRIDLDRQVKVQVLGPSYPLLSGTRSDLNNNSLVLRMEYGVRSFLFTGDVEQEAQARLLLRHSLKADVLKVPHHGSGAFVPDFFRAARPEVAVISVGRDNRFGHPHPRTLEVLQETGATVYRTDRDGAVIISTDGHNLEIMTGREQETQEPAA